MSHIAAALAKSKGKNVPSPATPGATGGAGGGLPALRIGPQTTPVLIKPGAVQVAPLASGSTVTPFKDTDQPVSSIVAPPEPPKRAMFFTVVVVVAVILGISAWLLLKKDNLFANLRLIKGTPAEASAAHGAVTGPATGPANGAAPAKASPAEAAAVERKPINQALVDKVRLLPITAAAGGSSQRLSVGGKVFEPGETVVEGLILQSIETEEIVFRDPEGNLYTRRL